MRGVVLVSPGFVCDETRKFFRRYRAGLGKAFRWGGYSITPVGYGVGKEVSGPSKVSDDIPYRPTFTWAI
jgi:hypothetical protein